MTRKKASGAQSLTITARQLADAVALVKPHIGTDPTLPMLAAYHVEVRAGDLYVWGTDRYTIGAARIVPLSDEQSFPDGFVVNVPATLIGRALTLFRPARKGKAADVTFTLDGDRITVEDAAQTARLTGAVGSTLPDPVRLFRDAFAALDEANERVPRLGLGSTQLAKFANVQRITGYPPVWRIYSHRKPAIVTAGDAFAALVMPMRLDDYRAGDGPDSEHAGFLEWAARFAEWAPKAATA